MPRRLFISDLDGTLLLPDRTLGVRSRAAIERHLATGGLFTIATGRSAASAASILEEVAARLPVDAIVHNGAARVRLSTGALRATTPMPAPAVEELYRSAIEEGLCPVAYQLRGEAARIGHGPGPNPATLRYLSSLSSVHPIEREDDAAALGGIPVLSMLILDEPARLRAFFGRTCGKGSGLAFSVGKSAYTPGLGVGEVQAAAASKASAAIALARELGLEPSALVAFGDNMNDLPLLLAAGEAYCPPDAAEGVLRAVPGRIASAAEEGVAQFLESLPVAQPPPVR